MQTVANPAVREEGITNTERESMFAVRVVG